MEGKDKFYFAVERGSGGFRPEGYLRDGYRKYNRMPEPDPGRGGVKVAPKGHYVFDLCVGDNLAHPPAGVVPSVEARVLASVKDGAKVRLTVNGASCGPATFDAADGTLVFTVQPAAVRYGTNRFVVTFAGETETTFLDFRLAVRYRQ